MNRVLTAIVVLVVLAAASIGKAQEDSRQKFFAFFEPLVGDWQIKGPQSEGVDYTFTLSKSKTCFVSDSAKATHVYGWNPEKRVISVVSFFSNGSQGEAEFRFQDEKTLSVDVTMHNADGSTRQFKATMRVVNADRHEFAVGDQVWVNTRRK